MIVVKRRRGQSVRIGRAVVTVLGTGAVSVRLGIDAPPDVEVDWLSESSNASREIEPQSASSMVMLSQFAELLRWRVRSHCDRTPPMGGWLAV